MKHLFRKYIASGLLVVLPPVISLACLVWFFNFSTGWLEPGTELWKRLGVFVCMLAGIALIGALSSNFIGARLLALLNWLLQRIPIFNGVYKSTRRIAEAFAGNQKMFKEVLYVEYPTPGTYAIAFATADSPGELARTDGEERISVFVPTTPNPTSGFMLCVPKARVVASSMSVNEAIQMIISSGAVAPDQAGIAAGSTAT